MREIRTIGDDVLRKTSETVTSFDSSLDDLYNEMSTVMYQNDGVGLAAPQIGLNKRIIVIDDNKSACMMINPKITWWSIEKVGFDEGCLSVPGEHGMISRPRSVKIKFQTKDGKFKHWRLDGLKARVVQHEIDHLDGVLFVDYL